MTAPSGNGVVGRTDRRGERGFSAVVTPASLAFESRPRPRRCHGRLVVCRGYIANRDVLVAEARTRRVAFEDDGSDAELFALAGRWWGPELVGHVLGEYAVVVADPENGNLIAAHDVLGVVPLFFGWRHPGTVVIATHLEDACLPHLDDLDEEYIADYLAVGKPVGSATPYRAIRRLLMGEALTADRNGLRVRRAWDVSQIAPVYLEDPVAYEERLRVLLDQAVGAATARAGTVWCELSGGLDSSTVAAMSQRAGIPVDVLSIVYSQSRSSDERRWMRAFLKRYPLQWHTVDGDAYPPFSGLPTEFFAEPHAAWPLSALYRAYSDILGRGGVNVLLTGVGGDHIFCADGTPPHYLADLARRLRVPSLLRDLGAWRDADHQQRSFLHFSWRHVVKPLYDWRRGRVLEDGVRPGLPPWVRTDYARRMRLAGRGLQGRTPRCRTVGGQLLAESLASISVVTANRELFAVDYEFRHPLLYRPLVEFMFAIPWQAKLHPAGDRVLQRRALSGILPEAIRERGDKRGSAESYFRGLAAWPDLQASLLERPRVVERGYIDRREWAEGLAQARYGRAHSMPHLLSTVTLELWLRGLETAAGRNSAR